MEVVSVKVDKKVREKMRRLSYINWSEAIRRSIEAIITKEELKDRQLDLDEIAEACAATDSIRKAVAGWDSTEEIRRWREARR